MRKQADRESIRKVYGICSSACRGINLWGWLLLPVLWGCTKKATASSRAGASTVVQVARSYLGVPYKVGGMDRRGMDCSGLVCKAYQEALHLSLPRTADAQAEQGKSVSMTDLRPGDLVFFREPRAKKITHVGIVSEVRGREVRFIHASTSKGVREDSLQDPHWQARFVEARRLLSPTPPAVKGSPRSGRREK